MKKYIILNYGGCMKKLGFESCEPYITKHEDGTYTIYSGLPEFGYELISVLPFAHFLHEKGLLRETISGLDTKCFYYFSPKHQEVNERRSYNNAKKMQEKKFPNMCIHALQLNWDIFSPPDIKEYYAEKSFKYDKPTVIITNRINMEWDRGPINFIDANCLNNIFDLLKEKYQIVYIETSYFPKDYEDHAVFERNFDLTNDVNFDGVIKFSDIVKNNPNKSVNELQCCLYSGCKKFITSNGGLGILASYFGGENIIFSKICHELNSDVNSFNGWYSRFSKSTISVVSDEDELLRSLKEKWIDEKPLLNIIIRTSGRPNYFHDCIKSVLDQTYKNINIIVGYDDAVSQEYIKKFPCLRVPLNKWTGKKPFKPDNDFYGDWFPYNIYFNELGSYAQLGYIIYLDDDDRFFEKNVLEQLACLIKKEEPDLVYWRVKFPSRIVPSDENWAKKTPICRDMSTIGFLHSVRIKPVWEPWKRGDFRVANYLFKESGKTVWLNSVMTTLQRKVQDGWGRCDDKPSIDESFEPRLNVIIPACQSENTIEYCLDSILSQAGFDENLEIYVGIDGCDSTLSKVRDLIRNKYKNKVKFFFSKKNCGPYLMRNSLVDRIDRRDGLVLFFDSDDVMPKNFLIKYYNEFLLEEKKSKNSCVLQLNLINFDEKFFNTNLKINGSTTDVNIIQKIINNGVLSSWGTFGKLFSRFVNLERRYNTKTNSLRDVIINGKGQFITTYSVFQSLGGFNEYKVAQDSDFIARAECMGYNIFSNKNLPWFLRRVRAASLEHSSETGMGSNYRAKIKDINAKNIKNSKFVADWKKIELRIVL